MQRNRALPQLVGLRKVAAVRVQLPEQLQRPRVFRGDRERRLAAGLRLGKQPLHALRGRKAQVCEEVAGLRGQRVLETFDRLDDPARFEPRVAQAAVRIRPARIQLHGLLVNGEGLAARALLPQRVAEVDEHLDVTRVQLQRLAVAGDRLGELSPGRQTQAEVVVRHGHLGGEPDRFAGARLGLRQLAELSQRIAEVAQHHRVIGLERERPLVAGGRLRRLAGGPGTHCRGYSAPRGAAARSAVPTGRG